ncbi:hyalin-like [Amphiura filiformis]|uniref:hyalin-like n=1 Tax=Amphiura filiformis TaxID=82378 RepID=UPI003B222ABA
MNSKLYIIMLRLIILIYIQHITGGLGIDVTPPDITYCPSPITKGAPSGQFKTQVSWTEPTARDDSGQQLTKLRSHTPNFSYFYVGTTVVTYWFIDGSSNVAWCSFTVIITSLSYPNYDITPPFLRCPPEKKVSVDPGLQSTRVTFNVDYSDNSGGDVNGYIYPPSGSSFNIGTTTVWVVASDQSGNTAYCTFDVIVSESVDICQPNPCPNGRECYRNAKNNAYKCDSGSSMTPLPTVGCSHPGQVENGYVIPDKEVYDFGTRVTFVCMDGFVLKGSTASICSNEMTWSSELPNCANGGELYYTFTIMKA